MSCQLADSKEVMERINKKVGVSYPVLVPNMTGLQAAVSDVIKNQAQLVLLKNWYGSSLTNPTNFILFSFKLVLMKSQFLELHPSHFRGMSISGETEKLDAIGSTNKHIIRFKCNVFFRVM